MPNSGGARNAWRRSLAMPRRKPCVSRRLERAVEAVLGERLQWVVVERFEHARAAVQQLRDQRAGAATFLPLERLSTDGANAESLGHGWAVDQIGGTSRALVTHLLGQVRV